jgi:transcriptional antiterminator NusG
MGGIAIEFGSGVGGLFDFFASDLFDGFGILECLKCFLSPFSIIKVTLISELRWYVVRAISGKEKKAREYLESEIQHLGMSHLVPQILIPTEKVLQMRNNKKVMKERNFFPGYVLIEAALNPDLVTAITQVPNIIGFLGGENPSPLRESEVNKILGKVDELTDSTDLLRHSFSIGESVKVMDGPFNEFTGVIEEINEEKKKLKVMVKIFGRRTPLEMNFMQVEKIS